MQVPESRAQLGLLCWLEQPRTSATGCPQGTSPFSQKGWGLDKAVCAGTAHEQPPIERVRCPGRRLRQALTKAETKVLKPRVARD